MMEKLLKELPMIDIAINMEEFLKDVKMKEKAKPQKNFDKINLIDDFLATRARFIQSKKAELGYGKFDDVDEEKRIEEQIEIKFY